MPVSCEALAVFALNPVSHRNLKAAATFQSTLNLLNCLRSVEKSRLDTFETKELVSHPWYLEVSNASHFIGMPCTCNRTHSDSLSGPVGSQLGLGLSLSHDNECCMHVS